MILVISTNCSTSSMHNTSSSELNPPRRCPLCSMRAAACNYPSYGEPTVACACCGRESLFERTRSSKGPTNSHESKLLCLEWRMAVRERMVCRTRWDGTKFCSWMRFRFKRRTGKIPAKMESWPTYSKV